MPMLTLYGPIQSRTDPLVSGPLTTVLHYGGVIRRGPHVSLTKRLLHGRIS